jgi:hypothetical protein
MLCTASDPSDGRLHVVAAGSNRDCGLVDPQTLDEKPFQYSDSSTWRCDDGGDDVASERVCPLIRARVISWLWSNSKYQARSVKKDDVSDSPVCALRIADNIDGVVCTDANRLNDSLLSS